MAIVCIIGIVALLGILDVFLLLGYALHDLILACAGFMVLMMILVTQDWQTVGVVFAIVAGSSLVMFFGTGLTTLIRLSLIHISEPTRQPSSSRMPSSA